MGDRDDPLLSEPEDRVDQDDRHDQGEANEAGAHDVDHERLGEHLARVGRPEGVDAGEGRGDVEPRVKKVGHPLCVGNAVVVVVVVLKEEEVVNVCGEIDVGAIFKCRGLFDWR